MTAITLLLQAFAAHKHSDFTVNVSTAKQASGKCNACHVHFGAKGSL